MSIIFSRLFITTFFLGFSLYGCAFHSIPEIPVSSESVSAGTTVTRAGDAQNLIGSPVAEGDQLPGTILVDRLMRPHTLDEFKGKTVLISIAPSLDTAVCERQTHLLGDASDTELPKDIVRLKITRDLPFAHGRFAEHTGFFHITYLSDYQDAAFGKQTGLLMEDLRLLARAVMVVDKNGTIRYLQIVPEVSHLPDMDKAFAIARKVNAE